MTQVQVSTPAAMSLVAAKDRTAAPRLLVIATVAPMVRSFLLPFGEHFRALGWRVDAASAGIEDCADCRRNFDRVWNIEWSRGPWRAANWLGPPRFLQQLVTEQKYDLVHVHSPVAAFVTRYALRRLQRRGKLAVIYTAHGFHFHRYGHPLKNRLFAGAEKIAARWMNELVVMNREDHQAALRLRLAAPEHVTYMPGIGVDLGQYDPSRVTTDQIAAFRSECRVNAGDSLLVMIAEFIGRKRHRDVLEAFQKLNRSDVYLVFAGDGPLRADMERLAEQLGVASRVRFLGIRRDIPVLLRSAAASLLPSDQEGLPRSVMESMCLGTPVIGSCIRGTEELLEDGCGLLFPVGDTNQLAHRVAWLLDHAGETRSIAERARQRMADYQLAKVIRLHESLYQRVLDRSIS